MAWTIIGILTLLIIMLSMFVFKKSIVVTKEQVDSVISELTPAKQETRSDGKSQVLPPQTEPSSQPCIADGFFSIVYSRQKNLQNWVYDTAGIFKYTGNCETDIYLEAGIINAPSANLFVFLPSEFQIRTTGQPSNCDGNTHYNGAVYHVKPNQDIKFRFQPQGYGGSGTYPINIGAYYGGSKTGCLKFGGTTIQELHTSASFSGKYTQMEASASYAIAS